MNNSDFVYSAMFDAVTDYFRVAPSKIMSEPDSWSGEQVLLIRTDLDDLLKELRPGEERLLPQPREGYSPRWRDFLFDRLQYSRGIS